MLPFAFQKSSYSSECFIETQEEYLSTILMLTLENQRLHSSLITFKNQERQMHINAEEVKKVEKAKEELQLKKIELNNMKISLQDSKEQFAKQLQEREQKYSLLQRNSKKEINQLKNQVQNYKRKYDESCSKLNEYSRQELQLSLMKKDFQEKEKEKIAVIDQLNKDLIYAASLKEQALQETEKNNKELRRENATLRQDLSRKEQQCLNLKDALKDAPKLEQLNRWIAKVKEYQQKQVQACGRISQMGQDLCTAKQKYRRLEHQYKEIQKLKTELEEAVTSNKDSEDSMTIYFDRLTTYQSVIKQLQMELQKAETKSKQFQNSYLLKLKKVQAQRDDAVEQWQKMADEMNKQRTLIHAMQGQLDHYSKISQQTVRNTARNNGINNIQSRIMEEGLKSQLNPTKKEERVRYTSRQSTSRDLVNASNVSIRFPSQNERNTHSIERLQTQQSDILMKDSECRDCDSRIKVNRCNSTDRVSNLHAHSYRNNLRAEEPLRERINSSTIINDEKRMLLDKLNYLKPQQEHLKLTERSLYGKGYQVDRPIQSSLMKYPWKENPKSKLSIGRGKMLQEKQNMNEMILRRYQNLIGRQ